MTKKPDFIEKNMIFSSCRDLLRHAVKCGINFTNWGKIWGRNWGRKSNKIAAVLTHGGFCSHNPIILTICMAFCF